MSIDMIDWALTTTRSVRRRLDFERPVSRALIERCIAVATQAPTGAGAESWRFIAIDDPDQKFAVAEAYRRAFFAYLADRAETRPQYRELAERLHEIPVLILACIVGEPVPSSNARQVALYGSILPAAWSLMVALRARGLGATWTTLHLVHEEEVARVLGIPDGVTQTVLLPVGHLKDARLRRAARKPAREVTYWNRWDEPA